MPQPVAITLGDPAGIGPEIILKALSLPRVREAVDPVVIGDPGIWKFYSERLGLQVDAEVLAPGPALDLAQFRPGKIQKECGASAMAAVRRGTELALQREVAALVTAPVHKEAFHLAGFQVEGQTEFIGELCGVQDYQMVILCGPLRILLLSRHLSLRDALLQVRQERILDHLRLGWRWLGKAGTLAVAGLNPHAGDGELFGSEERQEILPAIQAAQTEGIQVVGPLSPDTIFRRGAKGDFDLILALYHDQAFIPAKMIGFEQALTTIAGLPFPRISVIHGPALDRAGKGTASPDSMIQAILHAGKQGGECDS